MYQYGTFHFFCGCTHCGVAALCLQHLLGGALVPCSTACLGLLHVVQLNVFMITACPAC
jgi:hypothetical protein